VKRTTAIATLLFIGLIYSCSQKPEISANPAEEKSSATAYTVATKIPHPKGDATKADFIKAKKAYKEEITTDTLAFHKKDSIIKLPLMGKTPFAIFRDINEMDNESGVEDYSYIGQYKNAGLYVVSGNLYEHAEAYLVNRQTGVKTTLWETPSLSPDGRHIANLCMAYGLDGEPNGYQIWRLDPKKATTTVTKIKEIDQQEWTAVDFVWENNNTLIFKAVTIDDFMNANGEPKEKDFYYFRVKLQ
jgi:hypothetical protein